MGCGLWGMGHGASSDVGKLDRIHELGRLKSPCWSIHPGLSCDNAEKPNFALKST